MSIFLKPFYDTEGPFGLPMADRQALALEKMLKSLPREDFLQPCKAVVDNLPDVLLPGERADISWISEESIDRQGDIVLATGMDDSHYRLNPLVTMNHAYWLPPVGTSLWRKTTTRGPRRGIRAKTQYTVRPASWPVTSDWPPDIAFTMVQAGLLRGKSVGFLPLKIRKPSTEEINNSPNLSRVRFIIEKWLLLEYACVYLPAQQNAVVETVSKHLPLTADIRKALGWPNSSPTRGISFTPLRELQNALQRRLATLDLAPLVQQAAHLCWARLRGQV